MTFLEVLLLIAAAGLALGLWTLLNPAPRLVIDERGILDRNLRIGWIRWNDIEGAYQPHAMDDTLAIRLCPHGRLSRKIGRRTGEAPEVDIRIDLTESDLSPVEVLQEIMARSGCSEPTERAPAR
jgi:hypothetical protein